MKTNAAVLSIGNEILDGRILDTNSQFLFEQLNPIGFHPSLNVTCTDEISEIQRALDYLLESAHLVIVTGGLGPTEDDVTRDAIAEYVGESLELNEQILKKLQERFAARGIAFPETNRKQALLPKNSFIVPNEHGTAPGMWMEKDDVV